MVSLKFVSDSDACPLVLRTRSLEMKTQDLLINTGLDLVHLPPSLAEYFQTAADAMQMGCPPQILSPTILCDHLRMIVVG